MKIVSFFTEEGAPKSGLFPTIDIVDIDADTLVIDDASMVALTTMTHVYVYNYSSYDEDKNYVITVDGGTILNNLDRYQFTTNDDVGTKDNVIISKNIEIGRWKVVSNQMIFYDTDGTTPLYTFDLKDQNGSPTMLNPYERVPV